MTGHQPAPTVTVTGWTTLSTWLHTHPDTPPPTGPLNPDTPVLILDERPDLPDPATAAEVRQHLMAARILFHHNHGEPVPGDDGHLTVAHTIHRPTSTDPRPHLTHTVITVEDLTATTTPVYDVPITVALDPTVDEDLLTAIRTTSTYALALPTGPFLARVDDPNLVDLTTVD
jgi:hypothetical protein